MLCVVIHIKEKASSKNRVSALLVRLARLRAERVQTQQAGGAAEALESLKRSIAFPASVIKSPRTKKVTLADERCQRESGKHESSGLAKAAAESD